MAKIKRDSNQLEIRQEDDHCFIWFKGAAQRGKPESLGVEIMMRDEDMEIREAVELVFFYDELKAIRDYLNDMISFAENARSS